MQRKEFYIEYYNRTDRAFSDKIIWDKKDREEAWRKGQYLMISKLGRKLFIVIQYLILLLCCVLVYFDRDLWVVVPIAIVCFLLGLYTTDFSILRIELLYFIYRRNSVYCTMLHDIFFGTYSEFVNQLTRLTKKQVNGYFLVNRGKFYGKFRAICKNRSKKIVLRIKINRVIVVVESKKFVIKGALHTRESLISEIAGIINTN